MFIVRGDFVHQGVGDGDVEVFGKRGGLFGVVENFQAGDNRDGDAGGAALFDKVEKGAVVEKHLRDNIIGAAFDFLFQISDIGFQIGRLDMLFGIAGHADAHTNRVGFGEILQIFAAFETDELVDQFGGVNIDAVGSGSRGDVVGFIAADGQKIVDSEIVEFDTGVFGFFAREAAA